jgi:hypothetical protein
MDIEKFTDEASAKLDKMDEQLNELETGHLRLLAQLDQAAEQSKEEEQEDEEIEKPAYEQEDEELEEPSCPCCGAIQDMTGNLSRHECTECGTILMAVWQKIAPPND